MAFKKEVLIIIEPKDVFVGNPKALVTLEEFGEYESEACAKANEIVKKLLIDYDGKIRFNFRHFPLTHIHQRSLKAGEAAVATAQEGKFWEMHNILFANRRNLGTTSLKLHSKEAGVANKRFLDDLVNAVYGWQVQGDIKEGHDRGVKDVPTFFVNGIRVTGKPTYEELKKAIDAALRKTKNKAPEKAPVKASVKIVEKAPEKASVKVAGKAPVKAPVKVPTKTPINATAKKATVKAPVKAPIKAKAGSKVKTKQRA
jgi:hypothetical protein